MLARFAHVVDRERVLSLGPWLYLYMGWAVLIERWVVRKQSDEIFSGKNPTGDPSSQSAAGDAK